MLDINDFRYLFSRLNRYSPRAIKIASRWARGWLLDVITRCLAQYARHLLNSYDFRKLNHPETIAITKHGKNRLTDRGISVADIINAVAYGEIIRKYEDDLPLPSCLVFGRSLNGNPIHVVIYLITAYYPDPELWDESFKNKKE